MTTQEIRTIGFIGAGNMPRSIIGGMVQNGYPAQRIWASNPSRPKLDALATDFGIQVTQDNHALVAACDVIVLSVKPQLMQTVCTDLREHSPAICQKLVATIAAGIPVAKYHSYLSANTPIIRVMPNTPSFVGEGLAGLYTPNNQTRAANHPAFVSPEDRAYLTQVFNYVGVTIWLEQEEQIDVLGAVAGSGPAYFFEFMRGLQQAAERLGFDSATARILVQQTAFGAAKMARASELSLAELRQQVTSKGGSTAKGLDVYQEHQLDHVSEQAVRAAVARNKEMAKLF